MPSGFIVLDKTPGLTSFSSLQAVKRCFNTRKVGHAGTLDLFASGVLICLVNAYTRLSDFFMASEKTYRARLVLGAETDTLDPEGSIIARAPVPDEQAFRKALDGFIGPIMQSPPSYSAIHVDGQRASERTRKGETVQMAARPVHIAHLSLEKFEGNEAEILVRCSKGTYIRSLARDIARECGSVAYLIALRRLASGPFRVEDATLEVHPDKLRQLDPSLIIHLGARPIEISEAVLKRFMQGSLRFSSELGVNAQSDKPLAVFSQGSLAGIVDIVGDRISYRLVMGTAT